MKQALHTGEKPYLHCKQETSLTYRRETLPTLQTENKPYIHERNLTYIAYRKQASHTGETLPYNIQGKGITYWRETIPC